MKNIEKLFRKIDNPKALYKYFIISKFYSEDQSVMIDFIKYFCEITNIEPERTKKALKLSGDNILVRKYMVFEDLVLDDIEVCSDKWELLSKFAGLSSIAELYISSHLPSQFNESIINYFCDNLKNNKLSSHCLELQHSIFGTKLIKDWATAPEFAKQPLKKVEPKRTL